MMGYSLVFSHTIIENQSTTVHKVTYKLTLNLDSRNNGCLGKTSDGDVPKDPGITIRT
jgi:hypothetical protein